MRDSGVVVVIADPTILCHGEVLSVQKPYTGSSIYLLRKKTGVINECFTLGWRGAVGEVHDVREQVAFCFCFCCVQRTRASWLHVEAANCTRKRITSARTSVPGCTISRADLDRTALLLSQVPGTLSHEVLFFLICPSLQTCCHEFSSCPNAVSNMPQRQCQKKKSGCLVSETGAPRQAIAAVSSCAASWHHSSRCSTQRFSAAST